MYLNTKPPAEYLGPIVHPLRPIDQSRSRPEIVKNQVM